ncbi:MAG TPA: carboxypeptidase-like regulatory domain-containing protein [Longimicrobium sp.]|nr:carboxypeptidase-like regulatory domain-containing protein [Longimicrobium sp.]
MSFARNGFVLVLLAFALGAPALAGAQTVHGRVTEAGSGEPVPGAIVALVDESGARQGITLSDAAGAYRVTAGAAGTYRVRVERVGFAATTSAPLRLEAGQTVAQALAAVSERIVLAPVVATGAARRCDGEPRDGAQAATMWDEARKALLSTTLAAGGGRYRFVTETRERHTSLNGRRVMRDDTVQETRDGAPFESASAESLVTAGYVQVSPEGGIVHGVDAAAILSDAFVEHHCFGMRDGGTEQPGLVGLEFVPLEGRAQPDVRGVLWLDRATAELRFVEYGYTRVPFLGPVDRLSGRLDFKRLPNGAWVTERWTLVIPMLRPASRATLRGDLGTYRIYGLIERSGRLVSMQHLAAGQ